MSENAENECSSSTTQELAQFNEKVGSALLYDERSEVIERAIQEPPSLTSSTTEGTQNSFTARRERARMWAVSGSRFVPCDEAVGTLEAAQYTVNASPNTGIFFEKTTTNFDELLKLPDSASDEIYNEITSFWTKEEHFRKFGFMWKRGFLLWGPPGSGKTCTLQLVAQEIIKRNGIAIYVDNPNLTAHGLALFRRIEPQRPCVVMLEDLDAMIRTHGESDVLALLDGELQIDNVIFIACHTPETKILTKDLRWVEAKELQAGDELWGFDEHSSNVVDTTRGPARRYKPSTVISSFTAKKECVRVHLNTGESFVCTKDHPWLATEAQGDQNLEWCLAENLLERPELVRAFLPWEEDTSRDAARFAGMLEEKGNVVTNGDGAACGIDIVQTEWTTSEKLVNMANRYGKFHQHEMPPRKSPITGEAYKTQVRLKNAGGTSEGAAILGRVRADKLIEKYDLTGKVVQRNFEAKVVSIEPVGVQTIQSIETTSGTYFAEGFAVHNTTNYPERLDKRLVNRPSRFDIVKLIDMPNKKAREIYLKSKNKRLRKAACADELSRWVNATEGFSIAHMKELIVSVEVFEIPFQQVIKRLKVMCNKTVKSTDTEKRFGQYS